MKNLQRIRKERGLSQSQLSELAGVKIKNIQFYEQGVMDINKATCQNVYKLARALNVKMEDLLQVEELERKKGK